MPGTATTTQATKSADRLSASMPGFDPFTLITIISSLLPVLANLFKGCQSSPAAVRQTPQAFIGDHYDEISDEYDDHLVNKLRPHTRREARAQGLVGLRKSQLDRITIQTLDDARNADDDTVAAVFAEAP